MSAKSYKIRQQGTNLLVSSLTKPKICSLFLFSLIVCVDSKTSIFFPLLLTATHIK